MNKTLRQTITLLLFVCSPAFADGKPSSTDLLAKSKPEDWRRPEPQNMLYLSVGGGQVVIELNGDYAPETVANVKTLAHEKYWDGLAVMRVQDGYVVQWGDPGGDKPETKRKFKGAKEKVAVELDVKLNKKIPFFKIPDRDVYAPEAGFSSGFAAARDPKSNKMWLSHCYGAVGVGRDVAPDSGNGSELYVVIGHAPRHLDRNVTVIGRVLQGMEYLTALPRGHGALGFYEKPEQHVPISRLHLGSDVPEKDRVKLEVLRTDTPLFSKWVEARRNRSEDWFLFKAGHADLCNLSVPIRSYQ